MKIVIIGTGAMGSVFGTILSKSSDIVLINTPNEHTKAIAKDGLVILNPDDSESFYEPSLHTDYKTITDKFDIAIIFTKSYDTKQAAFSAKALLNDNGIALTMQNGIGNFEIIAEILGYDRALAGTTSHGATMVSPGIVRHAGIGDTYIAAKKEKNQLVKKLCNVFESAGIKTNISENITELIWGKLIINCGINALTAILKVPNGILGITKETKQIMEKTVKEAVAVGTKLGVKFPFENPFDQVLKVCENTAKNRASMLQDILRGKKTEIEAINGAIAKYGKKLNMETPYNNIIAEIIRSLESTSNSRVS